MKADREYKELRDGLEAGIVKAARLKALKDARAELVKYSWGPYNPPAIIDTMIKEAEV